MSLAHLAALLLASTPLPTDPTAMLEHGPIVSVEQTPEGRFQRCTALIRIDAPIDHVWAVVTDFKSMASYMPKVVKSEIVHEEPNIEDVKMEIDVPGVNTVYVMRHELHPESHTVEMHWLKGDLKGSAWMLHLEATPDGKTLLAYGGGSKNFSAVLESLEDKQQTISVGVNVSSALTAAKAWKKRAESK